MLVARGARISSMIELGVGFHPELTGRENVFLSAAIHGLTNAEIESIFHAVVDYSGLEHFIDVPIKTYSSGMYMRLGFAIAANLKPDILLLDEIFAVGDADFQQRCTATVQRFLDEGKTIMFVSHSPAALRSICRRVCVLEQGELGFDGGVEEGLAFYELESAPHRTALGGHWRETGLWQFEFLRQHGLEPHHRVLDVGCGSLATAVHLLPYLEEDHYWGFERNRALLEAGIMVELPHAGIPPERGRFAVADMFDLRNTPGPFDFVTTQTGFAYLPFNDVARCIASVVRRLRDSGRFYAAWFENPDPSSFDPIVQPSGITTYPDREPYHYPFELLVSVCNAVGATVERVDASGHPGGESMVVITRAR
jgi:energy-coupling factor transporter ATP-binding protein EcfA2